MMLKQTGPGDCLVFCDGRSRACRRALEAATEDMRHIAEIFLVFKPSPRLGRRLSWSSDNTEVIMFSTPVPRAALPVKKRSANVGQGSGESTTHDASYIGVAPLPWGAMNILSAADKEKILNHESETPPMELFDTALGQPLFWAERKPPQLFKTLFQDLGAKAVVDLTPGSGTAAKAAAELGLSYVGVARNACHADWLHNAADRNALQLLCAAGSPLHHQDLASCLTEHFQSLLDEVEMAEKAQDHEPEGDLDIVRDSVRPRAADADALASPQSTPASSRSTLVNTE